MTYNNNNVFYLEDVKYLYIRIRENVMAPISEAFPMYNRRRFQQKYFIVWQLAATCGFNYSFKLIILF